MEPRKLRDILLTTRWSIDDATTVFSEFEQSGLSATDFADKHGFDVQRLYWWNRKLGRSPMRRRNRATFQEVVVSDVHPSTIDTRLEIMLPRGVSLRVAAGFDESVLRKVLRIASEEAEC